MLPSESWVLNRFFNLSPLVAEAGCNCNLPGTFTLCRGIPRNLRKSDNRALPYWMSRSELIVISLISTLWVPGRPARHLVKHSLDRLSANGTPGSRGGHQTEFGNICGVKTTAFTSIQERFISPFLHKIWIVKWDWNFHKCSR
jgi:hypothetical protein